MAKTEQFLRDFARRHGAILAFFLAVAAATWSSRGLIVTDYFDDIFVVLDLIWRSSLGQIPHVNFHSPIGQTFYWPFAIVTAFSEPSPLTLLHTNLLVGLCLLLLSMSTLPARLAPALYFFAVASIIVTAIAPRDVDWAFNDYTHLAPYNRWGWALVMLSAILSTVPRRLPNDKAALIDGIVLGLVLTLLFYLKINFFLAAIVAGVIGLILRQLPIRAGLISLATLAVLAAMLELVLGNNVEYLRDIGSALAANVEDIGSAKRVAQLRVSLLLGALYALMISGMLWIWRPTLRAKAWIRFWWKPLLICTSLISAGAVLGTQNHNEFELALYVTAVIVALEIARRKLPFADAVLSTAFSSGRAAFALAGLRRLGWALLIAAAAFMPVLDAASIFAHAIETRSSEVCSLPGLQGSAAKKLLVLQPILTGGRTDLSRSGSPLRFVRVRSGSLDQENNLSCEISAARFLKTPPKELLALQAQQLVDGFLLIDRHGRQGATVLALNFTNPYPALLRSYPPEGAAIWWDERTFSERSHPNPAPLLGSSQVILEGRVGSGSAAPRLVNTSIVNSAAMSRIYGPQASREFKPVAQTNLWRMWVRDDLRSR